MAAFSLHVLELLGVSCGSRVPTAAMTPFLLASTSMGILLSFLSLVMEGSPQRQLQSLTSADRLSQQHSRMACASQPRPSPLGHA